MRTNGARRTLKGISRKLLQVDARYHREFCRQLGVDRFPILQPIPMDAADMGFADESVDFVFATRCCTTFPSRRRDPRDRQSTDPGAVAFCLLLGDWKSLFEHEMPGCRFQLTRTGSRN